MKNKKTSGFGSVPRRHAEKFDDCVTEARKSPHHARQQYASLLEHYRALLDSNASAQAKQTAYQLTKHVHSIAMRSGKADVQSVFVSRQKLMPLLALVILVIQNLQTPLLFFQAPQEMP